MSRQNKVNPGMDTQRGRLTQDDFARELAHQREAGSPQPWPPEQPDEPFHFREAPQRDDAEADVKPEPAKPVKAVKRVKAKKTVKAKPVKKTAPRVKAKAAKRAKPAARARSAKRAKPASRPKAKRVRS